MFDDIKNTRLELIEDNQLLPFNLKLYIKREDLIHNLISGNKWRKLKYNFLEAKKTGYTKFVTVGGAYSNHIAAVAAAGKELGFTTVGIVRGEEHFPLNPTLSTAKANGMEIIYSARDKYRLGITEADLKALKRDLGDFYFIPEGGTNDLAVKGASEITNDITINFNYICTPVGTGGTLAGLVHSNRTNSFSVLGFSALKNSDYLNEVVTKLTNGNKGDWKILNNYAFGGYAKFNTELIDFINKFKMNHNISLDPIYTGKMMFGIYDLIKQGYFMEGSTIIAVHTGGLQGIDGFNKRYKNIIL